MSIWMQVPGITGTCSYAGYIGWIGLTTFSVKARRSMKMLIGSNQGREGDTPSLSEIAIKKSPTLPVVICRNWS
jgi:hypothetical protein